MSNQKNLYYKGRRQYEIENHNNRKEFDNNINEQEFFNKSININFKFLTKKIDNHYQRINIANNNILQEMTKTINENNNKIIESNNKIIESNNKIIESNNKIIEQINIIEQNQIKQFELFEQLCGYVIIGLIIAILGIVFGF